MEERIVGWSHCTVNPTVPARFARGAVRKCAGTRVFQRVAHGVEPSARERAEAWPEMRTGPAPYEEPSELRSAGGGVLSSRAPGLFQAGVPEPKT